LLPQAFAEDDRIQGACRQAGAAAPGDNTALVACGDGVVPNKKQKKQLYPVVFQALNLPPWSRSCVENVAICTVIDGSRAHADIQPVMEIAMDELLALYWEGITVPTPRNQATTTNVRAMMVDTRYDLPGLAHAFRLAAGNPYLGACPACCQPGLHCGSKIIYPCEFGALYVPAPCRL
jgi:hypothetical protein